MNRNARPYTMEQYPQKLSLEEFVSEIKLNIDIFYENIKVLRARSSKFEAEWAEDWVDVLSAWMEMEHGVK